MLFASFFRSRFTFSLGGGGTSSSGATAPSDSVSFSLDSGGSITAEGKGTESSGATAPSDLSFSLGGSPGSFLTSLDELLVESDDGLERPRKDTSGATAPFVSFRVRLIISFLWVFDFWECHAWDFHRVW